MPKKGASGGGGRKKTEKLITQGGKMKK